MAEFCRDRGTVQLLAEKQFLTHFGKTSLSHDLSSPREWLEFFEVQKVKSGIETGDPYTVIRCDFSPSKKEWRIWGQEFHVQRLKHATEVLHAGGVLSSIPTEEDFLALEEETRAVMHALLMEVETACFCDFDEPDETVTVMLTLLWELAKLLDNTNTEIKVRGHALSSLDLVPQRKSNPNPSVQISLACCSKEADKLDFPSRHDRLPEAKLSSWCRRRRPLETQFKGKDIGEVILTKGTEESLELLEGLTSNIFVVCKDGTIRTPPTSLVLGGYVRQRVIDVAEKCGYIVEVGPLFLKDSQTWKEVFVTSSIRLIIPVHRIFFPVSKREDGMIGTESVWEQSSSTDTKQSKLYRGLQETND